MVNERPDVHLMLTILVVFSVSVGILHGRKKNKTLATHIDVHNTSLQGVETLSPDDAYDYFHSLLLSGNVDLSAQAIAQFHLPILAKLLEKIIVGEDLSLTNEEKLLLLLATAMQLQGKKGVQFAVFDIFLTHQDIQMNQPVLLVAARSRYADIIPVLISWLKERQKNEQYKKYEEFLVSMVPEALKGAVDENNVTALDVMIGKKVRLESEQASTLLWNVVVDKKDTALVPFLVRRGRADINFVGDGERTLLIKATENNDPKMVRVLLEEGAEVGTVVVPAVGSALQITISGGYTQVELLLREHGARE